MGIWHNNLTVLGDRDVIVGRNSVLRPDGAIQPDDLPQPVAGQECDSAEWPYPTVVVEVIRRTQKSMFFSRKIFFSKDHCPNLSCHKNIWSSQRRYPCNGCIPIPAFKFHSWKTYIG